MSDFWAAMNAQLAELRKARSADDVLRILKRERIPDGHSRLVAGDGFFAGSGGDDTVEDALTDAGWTLVWSKASYWYAMKAPDGSAITYVEGDIYRGEPPEQRPGQPDVDAEAPTDDPLYDEAAQQEAERATLPSGRVSRDPDGLDCYSDHEHDIRTKGDCDFCGSTEENVVGHVLPGTNRYTGKDPVQASAIVMHRGYAFFDGVLLDHFSASAVQAVYQALSTEAARARMRSLSLVRAVEISFKLCK